MGSGSRSSGGTQQEQFIGGLNVAPFLLGQAVTGSPINVSRGGFQFGGGGTSQPIGQLFDQGDFQPLGDIFERVTPGFEFDLQEFGDQAQLGIDTLSEAAETGLIDPAVALSQELFGDFLGQAQESIGTQLGLGTGDSDFEAIVAREASRRAAELGNLAADRRLAASTGLTDQLIGALGFEDAARDTTFDRSEAGQVLNRFLQLSGIQTQGQGTGTSSGSESSRRIGVLK